MASQVTVMFDLDGTLIDSSGDLAVAANVMLDSLSLPAVTEGQVESWIGHGLDFLVNRCLTRRMDGIAEEDLFERGITAFRRAYLDSGFTRTTCLDGVPEILQALARADFSIALVTNKNTSPTRAVLDHLDLAEFFNAVVCGDTLPVKKPDPGPIQHAMQLVGARVGWMIGDSEVDATASVAAGIGFIAVQGGYGEQTDPSRFSGPPVKVVHSLRELLDPDGTPIEMMSQPRAFSE